MLTVVEIVFVDIVSDESTTTKTTTTTTTEALSTAETERTPSTTVEAGNGTIATSTTETSTTTTNDNNSSNASENSAAIASANGATSRSAERIQIDRVSFHLDLNNICFIIVAWYAQLAATASRDRPYVATAASASSIAPTSSSSAAARGSQEHFDGGKLFVSGLSPYTDEVRLTAYFSQFGTVVAGRVMRDKVSGESRCFGFVTFADERLVDALVNGAELTIDGRAVQLKRALALEANAIRDEPVQDDLTLFIGRIPLHVTDIRLRDFFAQYATVDSAQVMKDRLSGASRGFGFVRFANHADLESILHISKNNTLAIDGAEIKVIKAEPKPPKRERLEIARQRSSRVQPYAPVTAMHMNPAAAGAYTAAYGGAGYQYAAMAAQQQQQQQRQQPTAAQAASSAEVYQQQLAAYQAYQQAVMSAYQQQQQQQQRMLLLQQQQQQQQQARGARK